MKTGRIALALACGMFALQAVALSQPTAASQAGESSHSQKFLQVQAQLAEKRNAYRSIRDQHADGKMSDRDYEARLKPLIEEINSLDVELAKLTTEPGPDHVVTIAERINAAAGIVPPHPVTDELVREAIKRGVDYLWSKQNPTEFHWEPNTMRELVKTKGTDDNQLTVGGFHGGYTALVLLALYQAGVSPNDARFAKSLKWLVEQPITRTYSRAFRAALLASIQLAKAEYRKTLEDDKKWLLDAMYDDGSYGYWFPLEKKSRSLLPASDFSDSYWRDLSNTQYGVLGMWRLSDAGQEVPEKYWRLVQHLFITEQNEDGGWHYKVGRKVPATFARDWVYKMGSSQNMALAGLASLFVAWDKTCPTCGEKPNKEMIAAIDKGLVYLGKNFDPANLNSGCPMYGLYSIERVGAASGLKYFGKHNWYLESARYALARQQKDGSWLADSALIGDSSGASTAFGLLFLSTSRAPLVFIKLAYGDEKLKLSAMANGTQWNSRPRDLARVTIWLNRSYESPHNWQIIPLDGPIEDLFDAPVLFMSGQGPFNLTDAEKAKLREYILGGGLLFGEAANDSKDFADSFRQLARDLVPELEMTPLPEDHLIYTVKYAAGLAKGKVPPLEGLGNGIRTMMLLSPKDLGCAWQTWKVVSEDKAFLLADNIGVEYAGDKGAGLIGRGESYMTRDWGKEPATRLTVGRLVWGGNPYSWNPEPAAWTWLDIKLRNANQIAVTTQPVDFTKPLDPKAVPMVHVTGIKAIMLDDDQKANLKKYVADGGILFSDSAGGNERFDESYQALIGKLFGPLKRATPDFLPGATDAKGEVELRHVDGLTRVSRKPKLLGWQDKTGRWAVLHVPYDVTAAMVGYPNIEPVGLTPEAAEKFVGALLKWVASGQAGEPK